jgi:hypothetical protein
MDKELFILLSALIFIIVIWYLVKVRKSKITPTNGVSQSQEAYNALKDNTPTLSTKERLSLSWEPIKKLAEYVISKFSDTDKNTLIELGEKLLNHGAKYIHVIDYTVPKKDYSRNVEQEQKQEVDKKQVSR